jgi:N utilization substance protein A
MNKELFNALKALEEEKGIPQAYMIEKIEAALVSAYKKEYGNNTNVRVVIDPSKDDIKVYQQKTVVEEIVNPQTEISLEDARKYSKRHTVGKLIDIEVKPKNFRRLSAMAAKSVIILCIRDWLLQHHYWFRMQPGKPASTYTTEHALLLRKKFSFVPKKV